MDCVEPMMTARHLEHDLHALLGRRVPAPNPIWEAAVNAEAMPFLRDHQVNGAMVFPGAGYVEAALAAQRANCPQTAGMIENLEFRKFLALGARSRHTLRVEIGGKGRDLAIYSRPEDDADSWSLHATASLSKAPSRRDGDLLDVDAIRSRCGEAVEPQALYATLAAQGLQYGPSFQGIHRLWRGPGEALAEIVPTASCLDTAGFLLHPTLLDAAFQALAATILDEVPDTLYVPTRIDRISFRVRPQVRLWSHVRLTRQSGWLIAGDITLCDEHGAVMAEIRGLRCQPLPRRPRVRPAGGSAGVSSGAPLIPVRYTVVIGRPGVLGSLEFREAERRPPRSGEVELRIEALSLNFKDVLKIMGRVPAGILEDTFFGPAIGMEAATTVVAVGSGVADLKVGDRIVAMPREGCFRSHVTTPVADMAWVPQIAGSRDLDQAGLPVVFVTALHALRDIARLQPGERVLLHSATGGVGLAAIQVARAIGAEIFVTAGSPEKRDYLRALGIRHVLDSRSLDFADEIMEATDGVGIDVLLNFLTGEALEKSLGVLAPFGRMVEIGKYDIEENNRLPLRPFNRNLTFSAVDIDRLAAARPRTFQRLLREVWQEFEAGRFQPLPIQVLPIREISEACRSMMKARHIGKLILRMQDR